MTEQTADWSVLDRAGVATVLGRVARRMSTDFEGVEYEDAYQDGALMLATTADLLAVADEPGILHRRLWCDLMDLYRPEAERRTKLESYDVLMGPRE